MIERLKKVKRNEAEHRNYLGLQTFEALSWRYVFRLS